MSEPYQVSFHFDGKNRWARFQFERPTSFHLNSRSRVGSGRQIHEENRVRVNGRDGASLLWCRFPTDYPACIEATACDLETEEEISISIELAWLRFWVREGTYLIPGQSWLSLEGESEERHQLRVWRTTPGELSALRERPDRGGPVEHARAPGWVYDFQGSYWDLAPVVERRPGLLYLELWQGENWLDATWVDTGGVALGVLRSDDGRARLLAYDLVEERSLQKLESLEELQGRDGVFELRHESMELIEIGNPMAVVRWEGGQSCFPYEKPSKRRVEKARVALFTDRKKYQRGETMAFFGWCRQRSGFDQPWTELPGKHLHFCLSYGGGYGLLRPGERGKLERTPWGGFWGQARLEMEGDREQAQLEVASTDWEGDKVTAVVRKSHQRQEYAESGVELVMEGLEAVVTASYATGEPIPGMTVEMTLTHRGEHFSPDKFWSYGFHHSEHRGFPLPAEFAPELPFWEQTLTLVTDPRGECRAALQELEGGSYHLTRKAEALVTLPEGRRVRVGGFSMGSPPDIFYLGLKVWGDQFSVVLTDVKGRLQTDCSVKVWQEGGEPQEFAFQGEVVHRRWQRRPGRIYARATDKRGRVASSSRVLPQWTGPVCSQPYPVCVALWLQKKEYEEGEKVSLRLLQDGGPGLALLRVFSEELVYEESRQLEESVSNWEFTLDRRYLGECLVRVDLVTRHGLKHQEAKLHVHPTRYRLDVAVTPADDVLAYGDKAAVSVGVRTPQGSAAAGADVVLLALDKAAITVGWRGYENVLRSFFRNSHPYNRVSSNLEKSSHYRPQGGGPVMAACLAPSTTLSQPSSPAFREVEEPLVFLGFQSADSGGVARFEFNWEANPGNYEVAALAAHQWDCFGWGLSSLRCQQPALTLRLSPPDYLWLGDRPSLDVRWQCQDGREVSQLFYRTAGLGPEQGGFRVQPGMDGLPLELEALRAGDAKLQFAAQAGDASDRLEISLPVYQPRIPRDWSDWGVLDQEAVDIPLALDQGWEPKLSLEVWTANPPLELTRVLGTREDMLEVPLRLLTYFWVGDRRGPQEARVRSLEASLSTLGELHQADGTFLDPGGKEAAGFAASLLGAMALWEARERGYEIDEPRFSATLEWLREQAVIEHEEAKQRRPSPWFGWYDDFLQRFGLPHFRTRVRGTPAVSPVSQLGEQVFSSGRTGQWSLLENRDNQPDFLQGISKIQLLIQLGLTPFEPAHGAFRFGDSRRCLGERVFEGEGATRWDLPSDLERLRLQFQGRGHLFYRLRARGFEPPLERLPGYGLAHRILDGNPPDENGCWEITLGSRVEVKVRMDLHETRGLSCYLPKPAGLVDDSQMAVLRDEHGNSGFRFRLKTRYRGRFTFPPAWVENSLGVVARTDWHTLIVK